VSPPDELGLTRAPSLSRGGSIMIVDDNPANLKHGTVLTEAWIERLTNCVRVAGAIDQLNVRIRRTGALPPCDRPQPVAPTGV
jgi:hypothetical protein